MKKQTLQTGINQQRKIANQEQDAHSQCEEWLCDLTQAILTADMCDPYHPSQEGEKHASA